MTRSTHAHKHTDMDAWSLIFVALECVCVGGGGEQTPQVARAELVIPMEWTSNYGKSRRIEQKAHINNNIRVNQQPVPVARLAHGRIVHVLGTDFWWRLSPIQPILFLLLEKEGGGGSDCSISDFNGMIIVHVLDPLFRSMARK